MIHVFISMHIFFSHVSSFTGVSFSFSASEIPQKENPAGELPMMSDE